jgi:short-subunit dehydrogenase
MPVNLPWKVVWITGASTGIGRETALQLAAAGVKVAASARSAEKLQAAKIETELGAIDLAIFGAGTYAAIDATQIDPTQFATMLNTNYLGTVNCLSAVLPSMLKRGAGHISWIASVAGYRGLPKAAAYGPSKAALINLAECVKPELALKGIKISVINPGFVETPMTSKNDFPMPFLMQPAAAAQRTIEGLAKGKFEIAYPTRFVAILKLMRILPYRLYFWIVTKTTL